MTSTLYGTALMRCKMPVASTTMVLLLAVAVSPSSAVDDLVDKEYIKQIAQPAFRKLKLRKEWSCVKRLQYDTAEDGMEIWSGRITGVQVEDSLKLLSPTLSFSVDHLLHTKEHALAIVSFNFPKSVLLQYLFKYTNKKGINYTKTGKVTFTVSAASVNVPVKLPKYKTDIKEKEAIFKEECQYKLGPGDLIAKGPAEYKILVEYRSAVGLQYSKKTMVQMFEEMKQSIIYEYHQYLELYVANVVNYIKWNCLDERAAKRFELANNNYCFDFTIGDQKA